MYSFMHHHSQSHQMDSLVLNKFPFDKLPSLHSITSSILLRHAKELNHRWLLPVFNAQLYLYTHLTENESICSPSLVLECHHCLSLFPAVYLFSLLFTSVPVGNPLFPDFLAMLDHSLHIATSPPREPSLFDFAPLFPALSTRRPAELPAKLLETLAGTNHIPAGDARNRVYFYTLVRVLLTRLARLPAGKLTLFAEQFSRQLLAVPANVMGIFSSLPRNARELAGTEFGDIFALAAALARVGVSSSSSAGVSDMAGMVLESAGEWGPAGRAMAGVLAACFAKEPRGVLRVSLRHLSRQTAGMVVSALWTVFRGEVSSGFEKEVVAIFPRLVSAMEGSAWGVGELVGVAGRLRGSRGWL